MEPIRHWKIILSLTAIFVAGAVTGGVITFQVVRSVVRSRTNPELWSNRILHDYKDRLDLSEEQLNRIRPQMAAAGKEVMKTRQQFMQVHGELLKELHDSLLRELTTEQRQIFKEIREEQMQRFRERGLPPGKRHFMNHPRPNRDPNGERENGFKHRGEPASDGNKETPVFPGNDLPAKAEAKP
ncbi:MAG: hypothetical protein ISQ14_07260 [Verrucomicrobiae bacterium]|jgi:hypothetical protein|nr:hypothetical protein [Verrucomicrobiae bacterium]